MTFEAQLVPGNHRYRVRTAEEHERAFRRAARHSRVVAILRKALPVLAVLVFAAYFISTRLSVTVGGVTASVSGIEVKDGNLRMVNPTLKGVDKKNGAYVISADYADQDMKNPKLIKLHAIKAELTTDQKGWSRMQAIRGLFNSETERLVMQDDIRVSTSSGITGKLTYAEPRYEDTQIVRSHQPVAFDTAQRHRARQSAHAALRRSARSCSAAKCAVHINKTEQQKPAQATPARARRRR